MDEDEKAYEKSSKIPATPIPLNGPGPFGIGQIVDVIGWDFGTTQSLLKLRTDKGQELRLLMSTKGADRLPGLLQSLADDVKAGKAKRP